MTSEASAQRSEASTPGTQASTPGTEVPGWGTEVARSDGPVPFLVYAQRRHRVTELLGDAARWAGRDHLVQGSRRVTFGAMTQAADRVAAGLSALGLGAGDRMLLLAGNSPDWVISLWAGLRLGAVVAPGNRWWSTEEIALAIALTAPAVVVADTEMTRRLPAGIAATVVPVGGIRAWAEETGGPPPPQLAAPPGTEDDPAIRSFSLTAVSTRSGARSHRGRTGDDLGCRADHGDPRARGPHPAGP